MTARAMVEIRNVTKRFGAVTVLDDVALDVPEGSATAIVGPSGSGKTTLIRCINHLLPIDSGQIRIAGELLGYREGHAGELIELPERKFCRQRASIGMVFQHFNLFHNLTAIENIMEAPLAVQRVPRAEARERAVSSARVCRTVAVSGFVSVATLGRPTTTGGDRTGIGDAAEIDAVR
jgi:ABC-type polar amino acid transport system ATPase subunit